MGEFFDQLEMLMRHYFAGSGEHGGGHDISVHRKLHELEVRMSSVESGQDALNEWATQLSNDVEAVANELATVIQQNQSGQLSADQVNAALSPIHAKLSGLVTANPVDPGTTTDPTNSPGPDSPVVVPAPDAPTDEPTSDPVVNPVDIDPASGPDNPNTPVDAPGVDTPPAANTDTSNTNDFREDL